jgi:hypothetical protein
MSAADSVPVSFEVVGIERCDRGRLIGLAIVALDVAGASLVLQGVRIERDRGGGLTCAAPTWRHPKDGRSLPCLLLPPELTDAIAAAVLHLFNTPARPA